MFFLAKRWLQIMLLGLIVWAGAGRLVYGQADTEPAARASFRSMPTAGSYYPSSPYPYYPGSYYDPYGGYLSGAADVINAQGQFLVKTQQAYQMREQARQGLDDRAAQAYRQATAGAVDPGVLRDMTNIADSLQTRLRRNVAETSPSDYLKAKRYLNDLDSTLKVLEDPNVSKYATGKLAA